MSGDTKFYYFDDLAAQVAMAAAVPTEGDDTLEGADGVADVINGLGGNDKIYGFGGNDTLIGGPGKDTLDGGEGIDTISYANAGSGVSVKISSKGGSLSTGKEDSVDDIYIGIENAIGSEYGDLLSGGDGNNYIQGGGGNDTIDGGGGDLSGDDTLDGGAGVDFLSGLRGNDTYIVDHANDRAYEEAGKGFDTIIAKVSFAMISDDEVEVLKAADGTDPINLTGNMYTQQLIGNEGSNILDSKGRGSVMNGGGGNDVYYVDNAGDQVIDNSGYDVVYASTTFTLSPDSNIDFVYLTGSAASLTGNNHDNILLGTGAKNTLDGKAGHDKLYGKGGKDTLIGGTGKDKFIFDSKLAKSNTDTIKDFKSSDDDLWLENSLFKSNKALYAKIKKGTETKAVTLSKSFFTVSDKAKDGNDFFVYNKKTGVLYYDKDGSGSAGMTEIAKLSNKTTLKSSDLFFI